MTVKFDEKNKKLANKNKSMFLSKKITSKDDFSDISSSYKDNTKKAKLKILELVSKLSDAELDNIYKILKLESAAQ